MPREATIWLRMEGAAVFAFCLLLYARAGSTWGIFLALLLIPDISMAGYLAGPRTGALIYNLAHNYVAPLALSAAGIVLKEGTLTWLALIWAAHIGLDRMLGFGLKLPTGFGDTHLGSVRGKRNAS